MKTLPCLLILSGLARGDLYVTNFTALDGNTGASGVWRNHSTSTDLAIPVTLVQSGGTVQPADGSSTSSIIDSETGGGDTLLWQDIPTFLPFTPGIDVFEPNFIGDYINIETAEGATTTVTLNFGATITDPVISLTDVEYRTTLSFPTPITKIAGTSNLAVSGNSLTSDKTTAAGDPAPPIGPVFGQEAAGSVQLTGSFDSITFTVAVAVGDGTVGNEDRTGYVVSTAIEPVPLDPGPAPVLSISRTSNQIMLSWPPGGFDEIQMSASGGGLGGWTPVPGLNPSSQSTWSSDTAPLGARRFFRGVYTP